jgi:hypothetical protein
MAAFRRRRYKSLSGGGGGGDPEWLPAGALAYADFVNGHYYADGAEAARADVVVEDLNWGTFDPAEIVPSTGFAPASTFSGPVLAPALSSLITSGATIVFTVSAATDVNTAQVDFGDFTDYDPDFVIQYTDIGGFVVYDDTTTPSTPLPLVKIAVTVGANAISASINGAAVRAVTPAVVLADLTQVGFYVGAGNDALQSITVYAPVANAALPALSAIA